MNILCRHMIWRWCGASHQTHSAAWQAQVSTIMHNDIWVCVYVVYVHIYSIYNVCIHMCIYIYIYSIYINIHIYIYIYIYIYTYVWGKHLSNTTCLTRADIVHRLIARPPAWWDSPRLPCHSQPRGSSMFVYCGKVVVVEVVIAKLGHSHLLATSLRS